jgi:serine/threonine protein kinase
MKGLESQTLGKYELIREIGRGSMGTVYLARDPFSLRDVAIKIADVDPKSNLRIARRRRKLFFTEAKAAGKLRHPNIIATIDAGIEDSLRYIAMEYVPGAQTLDLFCTKDNLLPVDRVVSIMIKCAIALDYAHNKGVIHRDIKPKNIMLTQEKEVKICDFGIALLTEDEDVVTTQVMGTLGSPRYMSPEQVTNEGVTNQSDIFSLGVVLYELLSGVNPFSARNMADVTQKITREAHQPLKEIRDDIPPVLMHIVDRTLKKHPAGRYRVAMELAADLNLIHQDIKLSEQELSGKDRLEALKELSFFRGFDESEIMEVLAGGAWKRYEVGQVIVEEGGEEDGFFVLVDGRVSVRRAGNEIDVLNPGASFGEISFFYRPEHTASIVAKDICTVLEVGINHIEHASVSCELRFLKAFLRNMSIRYVHALGQLYPN